MTRQELLYWVQNEYSTEPEYPWSKFPGYAVLRNQNQKWFGVIMDISRRKFGLSDDEKVDVLNVKADPSLIDFLVTQPGFFRAYHMNKNQWISVFLDGSVSENMIKNLLAESYDRTIRKAKK